MEKVSENGLRTLEVYIGHKTYKMYGILIYTKRSNYICDCAKGNTVARIIGKRDNESDYPCVHNLRIILEKFAKEEWNT